MIENTTALVIEEIISYKEKQGKTEVQTILESFNLCDLCKIK